MKICLPVLLSLSLFFALPKTSSALVFNDPMPVERLTTKQQKKQSRKRNRTCKKQPKTTKEFSMGVFGMIALYFLLPIIGAGLIVAGFLLGISWMWILGICLLGLMLFIIILALIAAAAIGKNPCKCEDCD